MIILNWKVQRVGWFYKTKEGVSYLECLFFMCSLLMWVVNWLYAVYLATARTGRGIFKGVWLSIDTVFYQMLLAYHKTIREKSPSYQPIKILRYYSLCCKVPLLFSSITQRIASMFSGVILINPCFSWDNTFWWVILCMALIIWRLELRSSITSSPLILSVCFSLTPDYISFNNIWSFLRMSLKCTNRC